MSQITTQQAFILCAGKGTRLGNLTKETPKCLVEVKGKPVLDRILEWLKLPDIIVNLSWHAEKVTKKYPSLRFSIEEEPLGTLGGIRNCYDLLAERLFVIYGDILTNIDLSRLERLHLERQAALTIVSCEVNNPEECGVIEEENGKILSFEEKPQKPSSKLVGGGVMICQKEIFLQEGKDIAYDLIPKLVYKGLVYHTPLLGNEWLIDMGTISNYKKCHDYF